MVAIVLEGGANRTYYTIGILDAFLEYGIETDILAGVSAGIANGTSYISGQKGRCLEIGKRYIGDKRYMGWKYMFRKDNKSYYNRDFIFRQIPCELLPFDYEKYASFQGKVYAVVTNVETGCPEYHEVTSEDKSWTVLQATCALPILFKPVEINGKKYLDGGCSDPLPFKFVYSLGCDKVISILTRERDYSKKNEFDVTLSSVVYRRKKDFAAALKRRCDVYNESRRFIFEKEKEGSAFVFCPEDTSSWKRTEKGTQMLELMYNQGYNDAVRRMDELKTFLEK